MRSVLLFLLLSLLTAHAVAQKQQPDNLTVKLDDAGHSIVFRRLPKSDNILPIVTKKPGKETNYEVPSLYLAEKEASLFEVKSLVSDSTWKQYEALVLSLTGIGKDADTDPVWGPYRTAVREGSKDYPAFLVDLPMMIEMCETLDRLTINANNWTPELETTFFRIPTRREWQYAARSITDPDKLASKELFPKWVTFDVALSGKLQDILSDLKRPLKKSATPQELVEIADEVYQKGGGNREKGYQLLGRVLKKALKIEANIFDYTDMGVRPLTSDSPSPWGFHRMIGNVPEWTLDKPGLTQADEFWLSLSANATTLSDNQDTFGVLMGGTFVSLKPYHEKWKHYSIGHGYRNGDEPWKVKDVISVDKEGEPNDEFVSLKGGVRLLVRRQLHPDWFVTFRQQIILDETPKDVDQKYLNLFQEICVVKETKVRELTLQLYKRLRDDKDHFTDPTWWAATAPMIRDVAASFETEENTGLSAALKKVEGLDLSGLDLGQGSGPKKKPTKDKPAAAKKTPPTKVNFFQLLVDLDELEAKDP